VAQAISTARARIVRASSKRELSPTAAGGFNGLSGASSSRPVLTTAADESSHSTETDERVISQIASSVNVARARIGRASSSRNVVASVTADSSRPSLAVSADSASNADPLLSRPDLVRVDEASRVRRVEDAVSQARNRIALASSKAGQSPTANGRAAVSISLALLALCCRRSRVVAVSLLLEVQRCRLTRPRHSD